MHQLPALAGAFLLALACAQAPAQQPAQGERGLAARYVADRGIEKDPDVIFADDFEAWTEDGTQPASRSWSVRKNKISRTHTISGSVTLAGGPGPGKSALEIACWTEGSGSQVGGLSRKLGNYNHANEKLGDGYDEIYVRWYQRFDESYRGVQNHGGNLGGRDLKMPGAAWVGVAAIRDIASRGYYYSGVQPYGKTGSPQMEMGFYSYHMDKKGPWGENYPILKNIPIKSGDWHCVERHMKLNSVDEKTGQAMADGAEELWIDGDLSIRKADVRFRNVPHLKITFFSLETYYHGLPRQYDADHPIKVCYDNFVMARRYIGPMRGQQR
jgi:hypothetical protein